MTRVAVTGGTGFVGGHLLRLLGERGLSARALTRREQPALPGVEWISGSLGDAESLSRLAEGTDAIIHIAGAISARDRESFVEPNIIGTERMIVAAKMIGVDRFVHVSSLAAREPGLSDYGWSKAQSEMRIKASGLDWTIVRPPAVYGPGDAETASLFRMAARGLITLPPSGRLSLIHVEDLSRLLLDCLDSPSTVHGTFEPDDGTETGLSHREFGLALGEAVGRQVRTITLPAPLVRLGAQLDTLFRGDKAKLTPDRARYFCHPDWVVNEAMRPPEGFWTPRIGYREGLASTAHWYREKGWIT